MKKSKKNPFETDFWTIPNIEDPFEVIDAFIDYGHIDYFKQALGEALLHTQIAQVYKKEYPGEVFIFYTAIRSFLRACSCLEHKSKKWKVKEKSDPCTSVLHQASLTEQEYENPFIVFRNAFAVRSLQAFELFLCETVHLSLSKYEPGYDIDLLTPYIHLIKMLDAAQVLKERGIEKMKKQGPVKEELTEDKHQDPSSKEA